MIDKDEVKLCGLNVGVIVRYYTRCGLEILRE